MEQDERGEFAESRAEIEEEAPIVSCFWCERLHRGRHPLSVCPECAARFSTTFGGDHGLDNQVEPISVVPTRLPSPNALHL